MRSAYLGLFAFLGGTALSIITARASAQSIAACGDIHVEAHAECELVPPSAACKAECEPIAVKAACAAELTAECDGQCNARLEAQCALDCSATCKGQCEVDPGKFDCAAACQAECGGECEAKCQASSDGASCKASCEATCAGSCEAHCDIELPEADCEAKCQASCGGSCEAKANLDCQIDCQADLYADCEADVTGGCELACESKKGALFCEGQYVDYGDNLDACIDALKARLDVEVKGYAEGSSRCGNGACRAEGEAGVSCSAVPSAPRSSLALFGLSALGLVVARRRRR